MFMVACVLSVCACCSVAVLFALRPLLLSHAPLQVVVTMLWMCTTVQQGHGRRLSSAWRAMVLQLLLLGTWLCSLGVSVRCLCREGVEDVHGCVRVECLRVLQCCGSVCASTASSLTRATADGFGYFNIVDVYNGATGVWSTAQLSVARYGLAAASVGNVALFAGGYKGSALFVQGGGGRCSWLRAC